MLEVIGSQTRESKTCDHFQHHRRFPFAGFADPGYGKPQLIEKLEFLITVASEKSFSRAAELGGVSEPTLSAAFNQP